LVYVNLDDLFVFSPCQYTRGYKFKLYKRHTISCVRANFFKYVWGRKNSRFSTNKSLYLANDTKCRHSYYGRQYRKPHPSYRMAPILMTLSDLYPRFQGHDIIQSQITRKWYRIELYLQWLTNRKSHMVYRTAPFAMTLTPNLCYVRVTVRFRVGKVRKPYPNFQMVPLSMTLSDL